MGFKGSPAEAFRMFVRRDWQGRIIASNNCVSTDLDFAFVHECYSKEPPTYPVIIDPSEYGYWLEAIEGGDTDRATQQRWGREVSKQCVKILRAGVPNRE